MTVTRGKDHVFVGMDIKFLENGKVQMCMKDYITESIEVFEFFGEKITKSANTPAKKYFLTRIKKNISNCWGIKSRIFSSCGIQVVICVKTRKSGYRIRHTLFV